MNDFRALLEHSFQTTKDFQDGRLSRLEFLADYLFDFTTYDPEAGELFAGKAVEVCAAINDGRTFDYIKDADNYRWFLLMVNMPFFAGRLEWGTSVRGAWWDHGAQKLESCGLWCGSEQVPSMEFRRSEWMRFIAALVEFAADGVETVPAQPDEEAEFELHAADGVCVAAASGPRAQAWREIERYAAQYVEEGPTTIYEVRRLAVTAAGVTPCGKCKKPWLCEQRGCMDRAASEPATIPTRATASLTEAEVIALARSMGEWREPITADRLTRIVNAALAGKAGVMASPAPKQADQIRAGALLAYNALEAVARQMDERPQNDIREFLFRAWHHTVLPELDRTCGVEGKVT